MSKDSAQGDQMDFQIEASGDVIAGKNIQVDQHIIYQNGATRDLSTFGRLLLPFRRNRLWKRYCKQLAATLAQQEGVDKEFSELLMFLSPADLPISYDSSNYLLADIIDKIFLNQIVILGDPGSGKSTSLRHLAMVEARKASKSLKNRRIPVFASLDSYTGGNLIEFLSDKINAYKGGDLKYVVNQYLIDGRFIIFFDSLNEMPGDNFAKNIKVIKRLMIDFPQNKFVFACRNEQYKGELGIARAVIQPLSDEIIKNFTIAYLKENGEDFYKKIEEEELNDFVRNPFFLWMVLRTKVVSRNRGSIIEQFVKWLFDREEAKGDVYIKYKRIEEENLRDILEYLGFSMMNKYKTTVISIKEAKSLLGDFDKKEIKNFVKQGSDTLLLKYTDSRKLNLSFWHQIIQEYFAACYLENKIFDLESKKLQQFVDDPWWWETIFLMIGIVDKKEEMIRLFLKNSQANSNIIFATALYFNCGDFKDEKLREDLLHAFSEKINLNRLKPSVSFIIGLCNLVGGRFFFEACEYFLDKHFVIPEEDEKFELYRPELIFLINTLSQISDLRSVGLLLRLNSWATEVHEQYPDKENMITHKLPDIGEPVIKPMINNILGYDHYETGFDTEGYTYPEVYKVKQILAKVGDLAIEEIERLLKEVEEKNSIVKLLDTLSEFEPDSKACQVLIQYLGHEYLEFNKQAIESLQTIAGEETIEAMEEIFEGTDWKKKISALEVVGSINIPPSHTLLAKVKKDKNPEVANYADHFLKVLNEDYDENRVQYNRRLFEDPIKAVASTIQNMQQSYRNASSEIHGEFFSGENAQSPIRIQVPEEERQNQEITEMTFLEHLQELQWEILRSTISFFVVLIIVAATFKVFWLDLFNRYYGLTFTASSDAWFFYWPNIIMVAFSISFFIFLFFLWRFVKPALYSKEVELAQKFLRWVPLTVILLILTFFTIARFGIFSLNLNCSEAWTKYLIDKTGLLICGFAVILLLKNWIKRLNKQNPLLANEIFSFVIIFFGDFGEVVFGKEKVEMWKYKAEQKTLKLIKISSLIGKGLVLAIIILLLMPLHWTLPLLVVFLLLLTSAGKTSNLPGFLKFWANEKRVDSK